jgi:hypothetical protein
MIFIIIIIILLFWIINYIIKKYEYFDINNYKKIMVNNNNKKLYKISLDKNIQIYRDDCFYKCNKEDCIKLDNKVKLMEKCMKCNLQDNKCFNKSIIGGNCDDCSIKNIEDKIDCLSIENYGCVNPDNINDFKENKGIEPYYIEIPDSNVNSPYNKKCVFCWDIMDNI